MNGLSRLRRLALVATASIVVVHAPHAAAQVPIFEPTRVEAAPDGAPPIHALPAPPPESAPPAAPPATSAPARRVSPERPSAPSPAKTDHIADQQAFEEPASDSEQQLRDHEYAPRRHRWYGWQTLIADGSSLVLLLAAATISQNRGSDPDFLVAAGLLGYEFAPGIVHFAHGNTGRGFASFGLRLGMPLAGAFVGVATASGCDDYLCETQGAAIGLLLGMGGAIALDAAVFAYEDRRSRIARAPIVPLFAISPRQTWLGIGGKL
jgi:hypothetical protein